MRYFILILSLGLAACSGVDRHEGNDAGANNNAPPDCGNGAIDYPEECDGLNLGIATCEIVGNYVGGTLGCASDCTFDISECTPPVGCGDGSIDGAEECDGLDLNQHDCTNVGAFTGGTLACNLDCTFNTNGCATITTVCGNSVVEPGEECDRAQLAGATCEDVGNYVGGTLTCNLDCTFNSSACTPPPDCGNGSINVGEDCDGLNLNLADCTSLQYYGGTLACNPDCTYDESGCTMCGNGAVNVGEECDGADLNQQDCQSLGYTSGTLACASDCTYDESQCSTDGFTTITASNGYTCALKPNMTLYCWGVPYANVPTLVTNITDVISIGAGRWHKCVIKIDGTVWCWGSNEYGQLGDGTNDDRSVPVQVLNMSNVAKISVGQYHTCSIKTNGTTWCWGSNGVGQLGNAGTINSNVPVQVQGFVNASDISLGDNQTCAVKTDGTVWCWGGNNYGKLGDGSIVTYSAVPVQATILGAASVSAGSQHNCAVKTDGTVWCWGQNVYGFLGDGTTTDRSVPVQVLTAVAGHPLTGATAVSAGTGFSCARINTGRAWCWGGNGIFRLLGDGLSTHQDCGGNDCSPVPVQVANLVDVTSVDAGSQHACALLANRTAWCWGYNGGGQLGDGTTFLGIVPVAVQMP